MPNLEVSSSSDDISGTESTVNIIIFLFLILCSCIVFIILIGGGGTYYYLNSHETKAPDYSWIQNAKPSDILKHEPTPTPTQKK